MQNDTPSDFPNIKIPSDDFICKRVEATIEGDSGIFYGCVRKSTGSPHGNGVFVVGDFYWIHCGKVKNGLFTAGRKVSVSKELVTIKLSNIKCLADGSIIKKCERYSGEGIEKNFFKDGENISKIISRLNIRNDSREWLAM